MLASDSLERWLELNGDVEVPNPAYCRYCYFEAPHAPSPDWQCRAGHRPFGLPAQGCTRSTCAD